MKLRITIVNTEEIKTNISSMQYAEHERAPIPVPRVCILSRNSSSSLLLVPKNGPRYVCQKMQRAS